MAKSCSRDLRERMVWAVLAGQSRHTAARGFEVGASWAIKQAIASHESLAAISGKRWPRIETRSGRW